MKKKSKKMKLKKAVKQPSRKKTAAKRAKKPVAAVTKLEHAPRRSKSNEMLSAGSLGSSLTRNITRAPNEVNPAWKAGQAGDLQGISDVADADAESVEELLEDGQALEAEIVEGVEAAPDEKPVPRRRSRIQEESIPDYDDRNKI